jgi:hypothetical protein
MRTIGNVIDLISASASNPLANGAANSKELPKRLKLFNWGLNDTLKGPFVLNERTCEIFPNYQKQAGRDTIVLDFEHATVPGTPENDRVSKLPTPPPVAAHMSCEVVKGDGLYCNVLDYTPTSEAEARNYKDLSATAWKDPKDNTLLGLHSVALTNTGAHLDVHFLHADIFSPFNSDLVALSSTSSIPMSYRNPALDPVRKFLGMDGMDDAAVMKCMSEEIAKGKITRTGPLDNAAGSMPGVMSMMEAKLKEMLTPLSASVDALKKTAEDATKATDTQLRKDQVDRASREGKVIPLSNEQIYGDAAKGIAPIPLAMLTSIVDGTPRTLSTQRSRQAADPKSGETGRIRHDTGAGAGGSTITMEVAGQKVPITLSVNGGSGQPRKGAAYERAKQLNAERIRELNHRN